MQKSRKKVEIFPIFIWILVSLWCLIFLTIISWCLITSVKTIFNMYQDPLGLPQKKYGGWAFENYKTAIQAISVKRKGIVYGVPMLLTNSLLFAGGNAFFSVLTACIASYILAKYSYIGWVKSLWGIALITNYLPIGASLAGMIEFQHKLGLYDSMAGNWLWQCGAFGSIFLIYYATWKGVAWDYAEAAFIDGASHFRTMILIMWPMTSTIFGVLCLTQFITLWNDYMSPLYYLPSYPTMSYGAWLFQFNVENPDVAVAPIQLAGLFSLTAPILVLFIIFRNKLIGSLTMGGLKG